MRLSTIVLAIVTAFSGLGALSGPAHAVPTSIPYTGTLQVSGNNGNSPVDIQVRMFDSLNGNTQVWPAGNAVAAFPATPLRAGRFSINLGSANQPLDASVLGVEGRNVYLQITVNGTPLSPRQELLAVPYAIDAGAAALRGILSWRVEALQQSPIHVEANDATAVPREYSVPQLTTTAAAGSAPAFAVCAGGAATNGQSCPNGDGSVGISFVPPAGASRVHVCVAYNLGLFSLNCAGGVGDVVTEVDQTSADDPTPIRRSTMRWHHYFHQNGSIVWSNTACTDLPVQGGGPVVVRLQRIQGAGTGGGCNAGQDLFAERGGFAWAVTASP